MVKHEKMPISAQWTDLPSEQTLKRALSALQRGPIRFRRNHVIACEGDTADYIFLVVSGVVRSCKTFQNGNRSVVAFYLPVICLAGTMKRARCRLRQPATP